MEEIQAKYEEGFEVFCSLLESQTHLDTRGLLQRLGRDSILLD